MKFPPDVAADSRRWCNPFAGGVKSLLGLAATLAVLATAPQAAAQISTVIFSDDFSAGTLDPARYVPDAPFFEGGKGDIHAVATNGVVEFVGTTSQQWWSGGTLQVGQTYTATEQSPIAISIDRVAEAGVGTASRSALWILDETETKYVLFADVRGEGGWHYNRKIDEPGDAPTGGGTDITAFNGATFDDGGLHRMKIVADGKTAKLYLDGQLGQEVSFPYTKVVFQFGSYARANNDTADTKWDNLKIEAIKPTTVVFADDFSATTIDPAKYQPDAPFFEGGKGDIHATVNDGTIEFVGTTSQQWWAGGTLRVVPTFTATEQTPVLVTIDRVAEAGVGTASRSALWVLDETQAKYVLFADVRGEGGWHYNRKIDEPGDAPTGGGTDIPLFNGATFDDGGLHRMGILADGKTVKLMLDGQVGVEVKFPYSKLVFHFGSYARANNDTADTKWDNLKVETTKRSSTVVFSDDFAANKIDPAKYEPDAPFFEGGKGDIHAVAQNGTMEFVGTTSQQWWAGGTLRVVPTFEASDSATLTLSIDRVAEKGVGTASRSALWILDETKTKYVLFADVRGEGGWHYNRKIDEPGDAPTGGGTDIPLFNSAAFDDGGLHRMGLVADGKTVKLLLDGQQGAEVKFPFSPVIFEFGSYARANNDTANTIWDNLVIETAGGATFAPSPVSVRVGATSPVITVRIPPGLNSQSAVQLKVVSSDASTAVPDGGTAGSLTLTFPAGGANTATFRVRGLKVGGAQFNVEGDIGSPTPLSVAVITGPATLLTENFGGATLDTTKWQPSSRSFEAGAGTYTVTQKTGTLEISGATESDFWAGASLKTINSYVATKDLNLVFEVDRVSIDQAGSAGRTGVFITTGDRSKFVFFSHNMGENGWQVNVNPGSPTGNPAGVPAFAGANDTANHRIKLVADGSMVEVFLDGVSGGKYAFEVTSGIYFELGAYGRATGDSVIGVFDNARLENTLPCVSADASTLVLTQADAPKVVNITIPQLLNDTAPVTVTVTSSNPAAATATGAVNGVLKLNFAAAAANSQSITIVPTGLGAATFSITTDPPVCVASSIKVEVVAVPQVQLADDFTAGSVNTTNWREDATAFDTGTATADSAITIANGQVKFNVTAETAAWPGLALYTVKTFTAAATTPTTFEIDRVLHDFDLVTGTAARQRTGVWVREAGGNFLFFAEHAAYDGNSFGWRYNLMTGQATDNPIGDGINIGAFDGGKFDDHKNHRIKVVVNGATAKLFLDGVLGAELPFPYATGLSFGFGAYVSAATDVVRGYFDNAKVSGGSAPVAGRFNPVYVQGANVVISWTGGGVLQSTAALGSAWTDVTPAPTGNSITVSAGAANTRFYRLRP